MAPKILVVDDDPDIYETLRFILQDAGYIVDIAGEGYEAVEKLKEHPFDLIILDIKIPGVDGMRILDVAKGIDQEIMVIIITGYASLETSIEALNKGAFSYLIKPLNIQELKATVKNALEKQRIQRENKALLEDLKRKNLELKKTNERMEEWIHGLSILYTFSEKFPLLNNKEEFVKLLFQSLLDAIGFDLCGVLFVSEKEAIFRVPTPVDESNIEDVKVDLLNLVNDRLEKKIAKDDLKTRLDVSPEAMVGKDVGTPLLSKIAVPFESEGGILGGIEAASFEKGGFSDVDKKVIYTISRHTSIGLKTIIEKGAKDRLS